MIGILIWMRTVAVEMVVLVVVVVVLGVIVAPGCRHWCFDIIIVTIVGFFYRII